MKTYCAGEGPSFVSEGFSWNLWSDRNFCAWSFKELSVLTKAQNVSPEDAVWQRIPPTLSGPVNPSEEIP